MWVGDRWGLPRGGGGGTHTHTYFYLVSDFIWSAVCWFDVPKFSQGFCSVSEYDVISKCMVLNCETAKFLSQQKGLKW